MTTVLDRAQNFNGGPIAAARQRDRWARQEANATDPEEREPLREAIADLEARYPDLEEVPIGGAEKFARERGHGSGARSPVHEGRRRAGSKGPARTTKAKSPSRAKTPAAASKGGRAIPGLDPTARRSPTSRKAAKGSPTPKVDRAIRQTGVPAAVSSGGSTIMAALGATVGLSLLYLLVSSAEKPGTGAAALPTMIGSVTRALGRFLSLEDVFPGGAQVGVVPGAAPLKPRAGGAELNRVEREAVRRGGPRGIPGEVGSSGIAAGALSNPSTELAGPNTHPRRRRRRTRR